MNSNQFQKLKTKDYPTVNDNNFEANSIGRHMDIDGSEKKPEVPDTDSQEVADINETASAVVLTEEDQSALRTVLNAENTFKMGNSYKDPPQATNNPSSNGYTSKFNNNQHVSADPTKQLEEIEGDSRMILNPSEE